MLISESKRFVFIHIYKCGGTSVRQALSPYQGLPKTPVGRAFTWYLENWSRSRLFLLIPPPILPAPMHYKASSLKYLLAPDVQKSYFKFSFVRNPWDWHVSLYHFLLQAKRTRYQWVARHSGSFERFIELIWLKHRLVRQREQQKDFLCDRRGNLLVDFVGRLETVEKDFAYICKKVGIRTSLPHSNSTERKDYRSYYNEQSAERVGEMCADDIRRFGYSF